MTQHSPTSPPSPPGEADAIQAMLQLEEHDLMFNAYYEGEMTPEERGAFEERLERDGPFKREYEDFLSVVGGLRGLPFEFAPDDFVERVQSRIRTRSAGRFFAETYLNSNRVPYEVIALVMIIVMAAAYMMMEAPRDRALINGDVTLDAPGDLDKSPRRGRTER